MPVEKPAATVYYDGSCPICNAEIGHYRKRKGSEALCFLDISDPSAEPGPDLNRDEAMARFHVRKADGTLVSGAAAFVILWRNLPAWRWAARLSAVPGVRFALEQAYRLSLFVRPALSRAVRKLSSKTRKPALPQR
jgi:predicted DCC family thiol-disulfide oxidoreductase YuxK